MFWVQLTSKTPETFLDLAEDDETLHNVGLANGQFVRTFQHTTNEKMSTCLLQIQS